MTKPKRVKKKVATDGYYGYEIVGETDRREVAAIFADNGYEVMITEEPDKEYPRTRKIKVTWVKVKN